MKVFIVIILIVFLIAYIRLKLRLEDAEGYMGFLAEKVRELERKIK